MAKPAIFPATFSMDKFDDHSVPDVEYFVTIGGSKVVFNADLVDSFAIMGISNKSASIRLHLRDGTPADKYFECTPSGVIERPNPRTSPVA